MFFAFPKILYKLSSNFKPGMLPEYESEVVAQRCSVKKVLLEILQNSQENTCARVSFLIKLQAFIKKETLSQVFCGISKKTFFAEHLRATVFVWAQFLRVRR